MALPVSPLAPKTIVELPIISGVRFAGIEAGIRYKNRRDLMLMQFCEGSVMAGVFTKSLTRSAPVLHCQNILGKEGDQGFAILANSGNSNAFTGKAGERAVDDCIQALGEKIGLNPSAIHMASTGVIGELLPSDRVIMGLDPLISALDESGASDAARAIMTTDTFPKTAYLIFDLEGVKITISGFAKGSGMIAPDMATMLGFLATDAKISQSLLQKALNVTTEISFNAVSVDSDMSTSDSVYFGATCRADMAMIESETDPRFAKFKDALQDIMINLAHQITRDGEGARKFVTIEITGAVSDKSAKKIAMAVANSPLIKTAIAGEDPNWGRMVMAVGKAGEPADRDLLKIWIGDHLVAENGAVSPEYNEPIAAKHMKGEEVTITMDIGLGDGKFTAWTCDLTARYIEINADYRS